jgi:hypothetical protein
MKKLSLGLGLFFGAVMAACSVSNDASDTELGRDDELNENKALGMTDVTILYPMPEKWEFVDDMLGPTSEDAKGELLPASLFAKIAELPAPKMIGNDGNEVDPQKKLFEKWIDSFAYLRIVGVRLDPCFGESSNLGSPQCLSTIRLVGQFFFPRAQNGQSPVLDTAASVHLFYKLSQSDFATLAKEMLELRKSTGLPLQKGLISQQQDGVHPTLKAEGLRGAYATKLKAILLKYAGEQTLERIAFSVQDRVGQTGGYYTQQQQNPDTRWVFGGFDYKSGNLVPQNIASLGDYVGLQTVDSFPTQRGDKAPVTVSPAITIPDSVLGAFNPVKQPNGSFAFTDMEKGRAAGRKVQNPNHYSTRNTDCVSCHMAKHTLIGLREIPPSDLDFKSYTFRLESTHQSFGPFRLFGWDQGRPVISQRVINETAVVLEYLNKNVLR